MCVDGDHLRVSNCHLRVVATFVVEKEYAVRELQRADGRHVTMP